MLCSKQTTTSAKSTLARLVRDAATVRLALGVVDGSGVDEKTDFDALHARFNAFLLTAEPIDVERTVRSYTPSLAVWMAHLRLLQLAGVESGGAALAYDEFDALATAVLDTNTPWVASDWGEAALLHYEVNCVALLSKRTPPDVRARWFWAAHVHRFWARLLSGARCVPSPMAPTGDLATELPTQLRNTASERMSKAADDVARDMVIALCVQRCAVNRYRHMFPDRTGAVYSSDLRDHFITDAERLQHCKDQGCLKPTDALDVQTMDEATHAAWDVGAAQHMMGDNFIKDYVVSAARMHTSEGDAVVFCKTREGKLARPRILQASADTWIVFTGVAYCTCPTFAAAFGTWIALVVGAFDSKLESAKDIRDNFLFVKTWGNAQH
jgi:hypothetical protein